MHILHVIPHLCPKKGGVTTSVYNQILCEDSLLPSFNISLISSVVNLSIPSSRINVFVRPLLTQQYCLPSPSLSLALYRSISHSDIIHVHSLHNGLSFTAILFSTLLNKHIVIHPHGMLNKAHNQFWHIPKILFLLFLSLLSSKIKVRYLNFSEFKSSSLQGLSYIIMPNIYHRDGKLLSPSNYNSHGSLSDSSPRQSPFKCVFLGRLHRIKRIDLQIMAVASMVRQGLSVTLTVIGPDDGELDKLIALVSKLKIQEHVFFEGLIPYANLPAVLDKFDLLLLTSYTEAAPMAVIDALSLGIPVLITDTIEHISSIHPSAFIKSLSNPQSIAQTLISLLPTSLLYKSIVKAAQVYRDKLDQDNLSSLRSLYAAIF